MLTMMLNKRNENEAARLASQGGVPLATKQKGNIQGEQHKARRKTVLNGIKKQLK